MMLFCKWNNSGETNLSLKTSKPPKIGKFFLKRHKSDLDKWFRKKEYNSLVDGMWDELRVMVPLETRYVRIQSCHDVASHMPS
jgi:hypothetical protein